jgi:hypothetical protein
MRQTATRSPCRMPCIALLGEHVTNTEGARLISRSAVREPAPLLQPHEQSVTADPFTKVTNHAGLLAPALSLMRLGGYRARGLRSDGASWARAAP